LAVPPRAPSEWWPATSRGRRPATH
jgi:hypothetical protein